MQRDPAFFNVAENYRVATSSVLDAQKEAFHVLAHSRKMWHDASQGTEDTASRCRNVAMLCARAGEHSAAARLLRVSLEHAALQPSAHAAIAEATSSIKATLPEGEKWRLEAAQLILEDDIVAPWPATLATLIVDGDKTDVLLTAFSHLVSSLAREKPFVAGAPVLVRFASRWETGQISRTQGINYDVKLTSGHELSGVVQRDVLAQGQRGVGGLLCEAARMGSSTLTALLIQVTAVEARTLSCTGDRPCAC
jgi:hypothetical protein